MIYENLKYPVVENNYGFQWGEVLVERTAADAGKRKFQDLRVFTPDGRIVEIRMTKRNTRVLVIGKYINRETPATVDKVYPIKDKLK